MDSLRRDRLHGRFDWAERKVDEIALAARDIVDGVASKDRLADSMRACWRGLRDQWSWEARLGQSWHSDHLEHANRILVESIDGEESFEELHDRLCGELVQEATILVEALGEALESAIEEASTRAFRLGKCVGQGLWPADAYRRTASCPTHQQSRNLTGGEWWLATRDPAPGEVMPDPYWFSQVRQRWSELGVSDQLPESFSRIEGTRSVGELAAMIEDVIARARAVLASVGGSVDEEDTRDWIISSRANLNSALGYSTTYSNKLEKLQARGELEMERRDSRFAVRFADPVKHARIKAKIDNT